MIVSHKHRFIFLKTRKTAGTSIELALARLAGDDAVVTRLRPREPGHEPRNYEAAVSPGDWTPNDIRRMLSEIALSHDYEKYEPHVSAIPYFNHMPAWMVRAKLGRELWDDYFKVCFERNPWEKVASNYWWQFRDTVHPPDFDDWLLRGAGAESDWSIYTLWGGIAVDMIGRYEKLTDDLDRLAARLGLRLDAGALLRAKSNARRDRPLYSLEAVAHVRRIFSREIAAFGYECPEDLPIVR